MMHEKRLNNRLTQYWELIKKEDEMPSFAKFNSAAIEDVWGNCVLFSVNKSMEDAKSYTFYRVGDKVKKLYGEDLTGNSIKVKQKAFKGAAIIKKVDEIIQQPQPIYDQGQFVNDNNKIVKFRSCLLPFGENGEVSHIIAGLSWREFG